MKQSLIMDLGRRESKIWRTRKIQVALVGVPHFSCRQLKKLLPRPLQLPLTLQIVFEENTTDGLLISGNLTLKLLKIVVPNKNNISLDADAEECK